MIDRSKLLIVVSHSVRFLRKVSTRCLWLQDGKVVEFGRPRKVLKAYTASTGVEEEDDLFDDDEI